MDELNPQREQMADESMVRTLRWQTEAVWPQEVPILRSYGLSPKARILDAGCGTGEASRRLAALFPDSTVLGVDVLEEHLARARTASAALGARVVFEQRSIFELELPAASFDLTVCRHVLQSIPHAERAIAELARVTRPGGRVHLVAEDYGMLHFPRRKLDPLQFWPAMPARFGAKTGTDMFIGRRAPTILAALGLQDVRLDLVVVDTLRVPRATFAEIWEAWKDGYVAPISELCEVPREWVAANFDDQLDAIRDPASYAAWVIPVVSGRVERAGGAARLVTRRAPPPASPGSP